MEQRARCYVWPADVKERLLLADAVAQIEQAAARIRSVVEPMADEDRERYEQMIVGVVCAETAVRQMRRALRNEKDGAD